MIKKIKWQELILALIMIAGGVLLLMNPALAPELIVKAIGAIVILIGLMFVIWYFVSKGIIGTNYNLVTGVVLIALGIYVEVNPAPLLNILTLVLGIIITLSGVIKLQRAIDIKRMGFSCAAVMLIALINMLIGLLLILEPSILASVISYLIGGGLILSGVTEFITSIYFAAKAKSYYVDAKAVEISKEEYEKSKDPEFRGNDYGQSSLRDDKDGIGEHKMEAPKFHKPDLDEEGDYDDR